jgi:hypothetical protein
LIRIPAALLAAWTLVLLAGMAVGTASRALNVDEAWIGEQAWFFAQDGYVHSDLFAGYEQSESRILVYHRLLVWAGALSIDLLGFGLPQLRMVSLVCAAGLLALLAATRHASGSVSRFGPPAILASMLLFFRFGGYYRPEVMLALFAWAQWCLILASVKRGSSLLSMAAGVACGMGILSHLNGMAFAAGSVAVILSARKRRLLIPFAAAALVTGFGPLLEAVRFPSLFWHQFTGEFVRTKTSLSPLAPFSNLLREHQRLFREPGIIIATLATASAVLAGGGRRHSENPLFYPFALSSLLALALLTGSKSVKYAIPLLPFAASEIWAGLEQALSTVRSRAAWRRWPVIALSAALVCHGGISAAALAASPPVDLAESNREAGNLIPDGEGCVAPIGFVFDEIERVRIYGLYLAERTYEDGLTPGRLVDYARERNAAYVVLDSASASGLGLLPDSLFIQLRSEPPAVYRIAYPSADSSAARSSESVKGFRSAPSNPCSLYSESTASAE